VDLGRARRRVSAGSGPASCAARCSTDQAGAPAAPEEPPAPLGEPHVPPAGYTHAFPLRTDGRFIVDANGYRFKIAGVNWYGAEGPDFVVGGLDRQPLAAIAASIRSMGFNTVRLPWSNALLATNPRVDDKLLAANPRLRGHRAMDIFDAVIDALTREGLAVVLVNHTSDAIWCCSDHDGNGLWFNERYPESTWIEHWQRIARRYAGNSAVVGAELRNELRKRCTADGCDEITWGGGGQLDWHRAATSAGNAVHQVNRNLLVLVDGLSYAADLRGVYHLPIQLATPGRLVYATHDYSWFHAANVDPEAHAITLGNAWGYIPHPRANVHRADRRHRVWHLHRRARRLWRPADLVREHPRPSAARGYRLDVLAAQRHADVGRRPDVRRGRVLWSPRPDVDATGIARGARCAARAHAGQ
jgi:endoglucanase